METFEVIFLIWGAIYLVFALFAWRLNAAKQSEHLGGFPLEELTVIVPFRNERDNLETLCDYFNLQNEKPRHVIFVDDHSTDAGPELLDFFMRDKEVSYELIRLDKSTYGKKEAIMAGVKQAKTSYCHSLDADLHLDYNFYHNMPDPEGNDMLILPVRMTGFNFLTFILELEYGSFQILQAMVPRDKPLMASGANLIFKRDAYLKYNKLEEHGHRSSGDDQYALAQFLKYKLKVKTFFDVRLSIDTDTPDNLKQLFQQRLRWMGNNTQGKDWRASFFAILIFLLNSTFLGLTIWSALSYDVLSILGLVILKILFDYIVFYAWFTRNKTWELRDYLPALSLFYPVYLILLPLAYLLFGRRIKWKNRAIVK